MREFEDEHHEGDQDPVSTAGSRPGGTWLNIGVFVVLLALAVGAAGYLCRRVLLRSGAPEQVETERPAYDDESRESGGPLPSSPAPASRLSPAEPLPIARDFPRPKTVEEMIDEATRTAEDLVRSFPDDPDAFELRARVQFYLENHRAAVECWERCLELNPSYAYAHHGLGLVAAKKGDYEEAAAHQRRALALSPGFSEAAVELADSLIKSSNIEEAIRVLDNHLRVNPRSAASLIVKGQAHLELREYEDAKKAFQAAVGLDPHVPRAQFGLATALARLGHAEESKQAMQRFKEVSGRGHPGTSSGGPGESGRSGESVGGTRTRTRSDDLDEMYVDFAVRFTYAGRVCLGHQEVAEAERLLRRAATLDPADTQCRVLLASLYQRTNRGEEALRMCRQLVEIEPENPGFHRNLGTMCANLGRLDDAEEAFQEVIRLAPENSRGHVALSRLYLRRGRNLAEATRLAQEAVRIDPNAPHHALLSQALAAKGDRAGAISAIQKAIDLARGNREYQQTLEMLREAE